jgi:hypothetical protein
MYAWCLQISCVAPGRKCIFTSGISQARHLSGGFPRRSRGRKMTHCRRSLKFEEVALEKMHCTHVATNRTWFRFYFCRYRVGMPRILGWRFAVPIFCLYGVVYY